MVPGIPGTLKALVRHCSAEALVCLGTKQAPKRHHKGTVKALVQSRHRKGTIKAKRTTMAGTEKAP